MAEKDLADSMLELDLEKELFQAVTRGPLSGHEGPSAALEGVDARGVGRRTLPHAAVRAGVRAEGLVGMGADPGLGDGKGSKAVGAAEESTVENPEDKDRRKMLKMVQMVRPPSCSSVRETSSADAGTREVSRAPSAERRCPVKERVDEVNGIVEKVMEDVEVLKGIQSESTQIAIMHVGMRVRFECVESMMRSTKVRNKEAWKVSLVRDSYERLYATSSLTSCLLAFLQFRTRLKVKVDCDSRSIGGLIAIFRDHDGITRSGDNYDSFVDFERMKVYVGMNGFEEDDVVGRLATSLSQMSTCLAFKNGGRPYSSVDEVSRQRYGRIIEEAGGKMIGGMDLDAYILDALKEETILAREIGLISTVPGIVAKYGAKEGAARLREQLPSLLTYYAQHVMATLVN